MKLPPIESKSVLITGCSTGIGAATARLMRERGWLVIPTARRSEDLERLRQEGFEPISMDMARAESVAAGAALALERGGGALGSVVNNAGFGQSGALEDLRREHLEYQFQTNVFGLQDLTNRLIPTFRQQGYGRIVHISSVVGRLSIPFLGCYSASKFAVEALADAQRVELMGSGVGIMLIEPGPIITEFRRTASKRATETLDTATSVHGRLYQTEIQARVERQKKPDWIHKSPADVALLIAHALESTRPKRRYRITPPAHLGEFVRRFVPVGIVDGLFAAKLKQPST